MDEGGRDGTVLTIGTVELDPGCDFRMRPLTEDETKVFFEKVSK
jgi:hypothetical protein